MKIRLKLPTFTACLFAGCLAAFSQAPTGQFSYSFTNTPLWDFSGTYTTSFNVVGETVTLQLAQAANGKITGTLTDSIQETAISTGAGTSLVTNTDHVYASVAVKGRTFCTANATGFITLPFREQFTGTTADGTQMLNINFSPLLGQAIGHSKSTLVPSLLAFQNTGARRVCWVGGVPECVTDYQYSEINQMALPAGMNGNWTLGIQLAADGNMLSGTAIVTLSNGRTLNYTVKGSYHPGRQTSTLRMIGFSETLGSSIVFRGSNTNMQLTSLTCNVLGQRPKIRQ